MTTKWCGKMNHKDFFKKKNKAHWRMYQRLRCLPYTSQFSCLKFSRYAFLFHVSLLMFCFSVLLLKIWDYAGFIRVLRSVSCLPLPLSSFRLVAVFSFHLSGLISCFLYGCSVVSLTTFYNIFILCNPV